MTKLINSRINSFFRAGDIVTVRFLVKNKMRGFRGLCISVSKKKLMDVNTTFTLRNVFGSVSVEQSIPLRSCCILQFKLRKYEKKKESYRKSKLFYLRYKINRESQVRSGLF